VSALVDRVREWTGGGDVGLRARLSRASLLEGMIVAWRYDGVGEDGQDVWTLVEPAFLKDGDKMFLPPQRYGDAFNVDGRSMNVMPGEVVEGRLRISDV
jgi:hypothetical protein